MFEKDAQDWDDDGEPMPSISPGQLSQCQLLISISILHYYVLALITFLDQEKQIGTSRLLLAPSKPRLMCSGKVSFQS